MWLAAWRSLLGHRVRLLLSALGIILSVAFVAGSLIFTNMLNQAFTNVLKGTLADVNVAAEGTYDQDIFGQVNETARLTPTNLLAIEGVPGVASVTGVVSSFSAHAVAKNGKLVGFPGAVSAASNWFTAPAAEGGAGIVLRSGRAPQADDEMVIDPAALQRSGYQLGDVMDVVTSKSGTVRKKIVGTAEWGDSGGTVGGTYMFFTTKESQRLFNEGKDTFLVAWVVAEPNVDGDELARRVGQVIPTGFEAISADVAAEKSSTTLQTTLGFINTFLLVFAGIAVLVASLLIANTFNILVAQRSRELALLRAVGAKRRQVRASVLAEALFVGLVAASAGLLLGWGLAWAIKAAFGRFGVEIGTLTPQLTWTAVLVSYLVGVVVTALAALVPAIRASQMPPVLAITGADQHVEAGKNTFGWVGLAASIVGIFLLVAGAWTNLEAKWWLVGVGAVLALVGAVLAAPLTGRPVVLLLGKIFRRTHGEVGVLAERNTLRQPRRLASTASALMIGLALVTTVAVLGSSAEATLGVAVDDGLRGDLQVSSLTLQPFTSDFGDKMQDVDGVAVVHRLKVATVFVGDGPNRSQTTLSGQAEASFDQVLAQKMVEGVFPSEPDTVMVSEYRAKRSSYRLGDSIKVQQTGGEAHVLRVVGIFSNPDGVRAGGMIVNPQTLAAISPVDFDHLITVQLAPGADVQRVRAALDDVVSSDPALIVTNQKEWAELQVGQVSLALNLIYALLGLALVIAVMGIVNTLALAIIERTREIGLLRAVGMTRPQLRRLVTLEAVMIAVLGSLLGVVLGLVFGVSLWKAAESDGLRRLGIPWLQLLIFLVTSAVMGMIAAVWPARRAAKLDILAAIATD